MSLARALVEIASTSLLGLICGGFFKSKGFGVAAGSAKLSLVSLKL